MRVYLKCDKCGNNMVNFTNYDNRIGYRVMRFRCNVEACKHTEKLEVVVDSSLYKKARIHDRIKKLFGGQNETTHVFTTAERGVCI